MGWISRGCGEDGCSGDTGVGKYGGENTRITAELAEGSLISYSNILTSDEMLSVLQAIAYTIAERSSAIGAVNNIPVVQSGSEPSSVYRMS